MNNVDRQQQAYKLFRHDRQLPKDAIRDDLFIVKLIKENYPNHAPKILDVGCGTGFILEHLTKLNNTAEYHGIDITDINFSYLKNKGVITNIVDLEKESLPYKNNHFDIVFSTEVIEHLSNTDNYLFEINRILKKNGIFIISFPNINTLQSIYLQIFLDYPPRYSARYKSPHVKDFTKRLVIKLLNNYHFVTSGVYGNKSPLGLFNWLPILCDQIVIICKKTQNARIDKRSVIWSTNEI